MGHMQMFAVRPHEPQIIWFVVLFVAVYVMNDLAFIKRATEYSFHDKPMFSDISIAIGGRMSGREDQSIAVLNNKWLATIGAKALARAESLPLHQPLMRQRDIAREAVSCLVDPSGRQNARLGTVKMFRLLNLKGKPVEGSFASSTRRIRCAGGASPSCESLQPGACFGANNASGKRRLVAPPIAEDVSAGEQSARRVDNGLSASSAGRLHVSIIDENGLLFNGVSSRHMELPWRS